MRYPIVEVISKDGYTLHGLLSVPKRKTDWIVIHVHGTSGNFYQSKFYPYLFTLVDDPGIAFLSVNNRGTSVYDIEKGTKYRGAAIEIFEECLLDIDVWIEFAQSRGYTRVILEGHSFGTNKIQYYALNGKHRSAVKALILLGFTDSYGGQLEYLERTGRKNEDILDEAQKLLKQNKPLQLLSDMFINWGELPQTAQSYRDFMKSDSILSKVLPLREKRTLDNFKKIQIPILGIVGDTNECTVIPPQEAVDFLNRENKNAQCYVIEHCDHSYTGKEGELMDLIRPFITRVIKGE